MKVIFESSQLDTVFVDKIIEGLKDIPEVSPQEYSLEKTSDGGIKITVKNTVSTLNPQTQMLDIKIPDELFNQKIIPNFDKYYDTLQDFKSSLDIFKYINDTIKDIVKHQNDEDF